jgi:S1-C subfamily serine protease
LAEEQGLDPFTTGVVVVSVSGEGEGARAGLRAGDIVVDTNDSPVTSVGDLESRLKGGTQGRVTILRGDRRITAVLFL